MSRIGQKPIIVPDKVKIAVQGPLVNIEGPRGKLKHTLPDGIAARLDGKTLLVEKQGETRQHKALHGLSRSLLANFVQGANEGFQKKLEIQGVGFKAALQGKTLVLNLGFSHPINFAVPDDIKVTVTDNVNILIEGADKQKVGAVAADIRAFYPPEPYKGKGVRYSGEQIIRKEGKTAQSK
ncbi:MAG: 50S ribosomal protein L6 [Methylacidiphilales bacterium]|nr:50S ribosomal protein L6 [Candidatus Methylacidiphilales bacterium]